MWLLMSNTKNRISLYPNYYRKLSTELLDNVVEEDLDQISKDEKRTQIRGECEQDLVKVKKAVVKRNTRLGYV